ncbi:DUF5794 domain-containing protein [Candidatus Nanohalobium constans]|uniref:Uncharacterized protein n=1 Tax=Candidatus Nanohalobium constans TaxID=2565781 RepID=A0A5Q0UEJ3_9ARCH|nr:DUF5794 domain-containing protein [Candidatus Nanohalobium constans]QGA79946.1 hypothetical protein LC1Nh_0037 [Candidatus Nanohalobium constans]
MVLDQLTDGAPWHVLEFDEKTRQLAYILMLPLVDGVFATMLVSGYLQSFTSILNVAFTVFAGAGALAVLYSEAETTREARSMVKKVAPYLILAGGVVGVLAPIFSQLFHVQRLQYATGLAILVIALQIADIDFVEGFSVPAVIITGLLLSVKSPSSIQATTEYLLPALATVGVACGGLYLLAGLEDRINVDTVRKGGVLVLGLISASLFGFSVPSEAGLAVLTASVILSLRN